MQKEEENAALREQLQQFERRWSEYEAKMKKMEETEICIKAHVSFYHSCYGVPANNDQSLTPELLTLFL